MSELTKKQKEELQRLTDEIMSIATEVVEDYEETPSEISGSVVEVHEESPFLDERFKGAGWKRVLKTLPPVVKEIKKKDK